MAPVLSGRLNTSEMEHGLQTSVWALEVVQLIPNQWRDAPWQWVRTNTLIHAEGADIMWFRISTKLRYWLTNYQCLLEVLSGGGLEDCRDVGLLRKKTSRLQWRVNIFLPALLRNSHLITLTAGPVSPCWALVLQIRSESRFSQEIQTLNPSCPWWREKFRFLRSLKLFCYSSIALKRTTKNLNT